MKLKPFLIDNLAQLLLSKKLWAEVKKLVQNIESFTWITNYEKRESVKTDLLAVFTEVEHFIINLAIELAVAWLKSKTGKL